MRPDQVWCWSTTEEGVKSARRASAVCILIVLLFLHILTGRRGTKDASFEAVVDYYSLFAIRPVQTGR